MKWKKEQEMGTIFENTTSYMTIILETHQYQSDNTNK